MAFSLITFFPPFHLIVCYPDSKGKCLAPFDTNGDGSLSRGEFSELCYELFVGTGDEVNYGVYDFDPDAIFGRLTGIIPHRWRESDRTEVVRSLRENLSKVDRSNALNCPKR